MTYGRSWAVVVLLSAIGGVVGWFVLGTMLRDDLQVELPGSKEYSDYTFARDAAPWAGGAAGSLAGLVVALILLGLLARGRRHRAAGTSTEDQP